MKLLLTNHLLTCADETVVLQNEPMAVLIDGETICKTGPMELFFDQLQDETVEKIDLRNEYVMPGMIDAHLHLSFSATVQPLNELYDDTDEEILLRMVNAIQTELKSGVTTVRDSGARGMSILKLRDFIRNDVVVGADIISAGMPITTTGGHCNFCGLECDTKEEVQKAVRMLCKENVDYIKVMVSGGNMTPGSSATITQYNEETLRIVVEEAHAHGKKVSGHVHTVESIHNAIAAGFDTLEHCSFKLPDGGEKYDCDLVDKMIEKGTAINPAMGKAYILPAELAAPLPDKVAMWEAFQNSRFSTTAAMYQAGVPVIAGTDAGCKNTKFDEFYLTMNLLHEKVGLSKEDAILAATSRCARILGYDQTLGSIKAGKQADIIALESNPLEDLKNLQKVCFVMKRGKKVAL